MSLGKDLASIRKSQNLSLEDIQNAVKIPLDTLESIENESIFSDSTKNKTYVRSFVRSYAKVLKIDDQDIVQALDELEEGVYAGSLMGDPSERYDDPEFELKPRETLSAQPATETETDELSHSAKADKTTPTPPAQTEQETINWADMGRKFTTASRSSRVWLIISITIIFGLIIGSGYIYWDNIAGAFNSEEVAAETPTSDLNNTEQNAAPPAVIDSSAINDEQSSEVETQQPTENITDENTSTEPVQLGDTLTISVYAAYGQLEPVRITSDLNWRTNPFWMEQGESYYFDFNDTLLVRGQYSRLLLMFNGHVIENPRQNYFNTAFNSIMITRDVLDQPRYLTPPPDEFPLDVAPPDSTVYRLRF